MPSPPPIDSAKLRATVSVLAERLAQGDYAGLCRMARVSRLGPEDLERAVRDYGRHLIPLPVAAFGTLDVLPVSDTQPQRWSVVVPLWSREEGRSDLSLEISVEDSTALTYSVAIEDLHVL